MSPDQILPIVLIIVMLTVAIILILVGIQLFFLLKDTRETVKSINALIQNTDQKLDLVVNPIRTLGSLASGVAGGLKVFESFSHWLKKHQSK